MPVMVLEGLWEVDCKEQRDDRWDNDDIKEDIRMGDDHDHMQVIG